MKGFDLISPTRNIPGQKAAIRIAAPFAHQLLKVNFTPDTGALIATGIPLCLPAGGIFALTEHRQVLFRPPPSCGRWSPSERCLAVVLNIQEDFQRPEPHNRVEPRSCVVRGFLPKELLDTQIVAVSLTVANLPQNTARGIHPEILDKLPSQDPKGTPLHATIRSSFR